MLRECHDGLPGGRFGRAKTGSLIRRLAFWVGQDGDIAEYVRSCQAYQRTKAEHLRAKTPRKLPSSAGSSHDREGRRAARGVRQARRPTGASPVVPLASCRVSADAGLNRVAGASA